MTYTASLDNAPETDVTVTLDNGETITINAGETSGSVDVAVGADEDVYLDPDSMSVSITDATGGNFENLAIDNTPAVTNIADTIDTTTVSLSATSDITESGGTVTYTASLDNAPETDVTVTLDNGETITIAAGETSGSVDVAVGADEDVYLDPDSMSASITDVTGGNFENLAIDSTPATTDIVDTIDTTTVSLDSTGEITEAGGTVTYTATVDNAPATDMTVTLSNGEEIIIEAGQTSGSIDIEVAADEDAIADATQISATIDSTSGGGFEDVAIDSTPATTDIVDTIDTTTVSLESTGEITEAGGTVTYTATVDNAPATDMTVTLSNGEEIIIEAGQTSGSIDIEVAADEDAIADATQISATIDSTSGGGFEDVAIDSTPATTDIVDTIDTTTVSLDSTGEITEAGGTVTYTATVDNAPATDMTVTLSNGEEITIPAGQTSGSVDLQVAADEDAIADATQISAEITETSGGGFEDVAIDSTPAVTNIVDTIDTTTVSLDSTGEIIEAGGTVTYTATVDNAPATDMTVTLSNGEEIIIEAGQTSGSIDIEVAADEDAIADATQISATIDSTSGGGFEDVAIDSTPATTDIVDTIDTTTVSLDATGEITEAGGTVTYTASVDNAPAEDMTVTLSNGETITIEAGQTSGSVDIEVAADEDAILESGSVGTQEKVLLTESFENLRSRNGWNIIRDDTATGDNGAEWEIGDNGLEVQRGNIGGSTGSDGAAHIELDSTGNSSISTDIDLQGSDSLTLSFDYRPRPGRADSSDMKVSIDGKELIIESDSGGNLTLSGDDGITYTVTENSNGWNTVNIVYDSPESQTATLSFEGIGNSDSFGAYVDNINVVGIEENANPPQISAQITETSGGGFEDVAIDDTPAVTDIVDTIDTTTVSLDATGEITEAGGTVTYTASVDNAPAEDMTVTLSNGETITIEAGQTSGSVVVEVAADEDAITDATQISAEITETSGGGFEDVAIDNTPATTDIVDTIDTTTVSLDATGEITEAGGTVTYTASVDNAPAEDMTVTLSNGETITIEAGETSGTVDVEVAADEDAIADATQISAEITETSGGGFEDVAIDDTPAVTDIVDTIDTTTVSLDATGEITEAGGTVTYTASVDNAPAEDMTVTLSNGETITIEAGETSGSVDVEVAADEDAIADATQISAEITETSGGGFEDVAIDNSPAVTDIVDTIDTTTVSLDATGEITEAGGTVTYTASVDNAPAEDMTVTLSNGETITIEAGQTSGSVDVEIAAGEDAIADASQIRAEITETSGGGFEDVAIDDTPATTDIIDTIDTTTVALGATSEITEAGGIVTYTAAVDNAPATDMTVTLSNGETITIEAGQTSGSVDVEIAADEDAIADATSISATIDSTSGGGFEDVAIDDTPATTDIVDTIDTTTVSLDATSGITEAGGTVTYTASVDNAPAEDMTVTLSNGETITIEAGQTSGSVDIEVAADEDVFADSTEISAVIDSTSGGGFEDIAIDNTPAVTEIADTIDTTTVSLSVETAPETMPLDEALANNPEDVLSVSTDASGYNLTSMGRMTDAEGNQYTVWRLRNGEDEPLEANLRSVGGDYSEAMTLPANTDTFVASPSSSTWGTHIMTWDGGLKVKAAGRNTFDNDTEISTGSSELTEAGGEVIYTAELSNVPETDVTVTLANGEEIVIPAGETTGAVQITVEQGDDGIIDAETLSNSISSAEGGNFEELNIDATPAEVEIIDTIDTTTVSLEATGQLTEDGGTVTYTATVDNAPATDLTITLSNGEEIVIQAGETSGSVDVDVAESEFEDVYNDSSSIDVEVTGASGGNYENLDYSEASASTEIVDSIDITSANISATSIDEAGGEVTYTVELSNPAQGDAYATVELPDGSTQTVTISDGSTQGTVTYTVPENEDVYLDSEPITATVTELTGGDFENTDISEATVTTTVADTIDTTTVSLDATPALTEDGGTITYTASVDSPADTDMTISLSNGETITIEAGESSGSVDVEITEAEFEDVYNDSNSVDVEVTGTSGGNFENIDFSNASVSTTIQETVDTTTVSLDATSELTEDGGTITYTARVDNPAETDMTVTLENGETITIEAGESSGSINVEIAESEFEDVYQDSDSISTHIVDAQGGNFENLNIDSTPAVTDVVDTVDTTTVTLNGTEIDEAGGNITYTVELSNPAQGNAFVTVELPDGSIQTVEIADGETAGTATYTVPEDEDVYLDSEAINARVTDVSGGNFENVDFSNASVTTIVEDTVDTTTVSLAATGTATEGTPITYTAELSNPADTDITLTLSNGAEIVIPAGESSGTTTITAEDDVYNETDSYTVSVSETSGGNFENIDISNATASTEIVDTIDTTTVSLEATPQLTENGGNIYYTATVDNPAQTDMTITLDNGQTITIEAGQTSGTTEISIPESQFEDVYQDSDTVFAQITDATGGNFENLEIDNTPAVTDIVDSIDKTRVRISGTPIDEAGGEITYTVTLDNPPQGDAEITVKLPDNSYETITIPDGETTGTLTYTVPEDEDVYLDSEKITARVTDVTGGNFEGVKYSKSVITVKDTIDTVDVSLSADSSAVEGGTITYTAEVSAPTAEDMTVTLDNGAEITIGAGETTGSVEVTADDDVYSETGETVEVSITGTSGGGFESVNADTTPVSTNIVDDADVTTVSLSGTEELTEDGGTITYTATLTNPSQGDTEVTVELPDGSEATISIGDGETEGTLAYDVSESEFEDVYSDTSSLSANITSASGGSFEELEFDDAPVVTNVVDTIDTTTVSLSASDLTEAGGDITYTATVDSPAMTDMTVTLTNGAEILIPAGETSGSAAVAIPESQFEDVYNDSNSLYASISGTSGGNFENVNIDSTPAVTNIEETLDTTTVSVSATPELTEDGGRITYVVTVDNVPETDMTVTLSNGKSIFIAAGETLGTGTVSIPASTLEDVYSETDSISAVITDASGGNFENLVIDESPAVTDVFDTVDTTTLKLSASSITEDGGEITYTARLSNPSGEDMTVTLDNGEMIHIPTGETSGSVSIVIPESQFEDVLSDSSSVSASITDYSGGGDFENLVVSESPAVSNIAETIDSTTVSLDATPELTEDGGTITYTASVDTEAAGTDMTVMLSNGEEIVIPAGETSGSITVDISESQFEDVYADSGSVSATITGTSGGNFENILIDDTPAVTNVAETEDVTNLKLSATSELTEDGGTITYTATVDSPVESDMTVTLDNGEEILISAGHTQGFAQVTVSESEFEDVHVDSGSVSAAITGVDGGEEFEHLVIDETPAVTSIIDTVDSVSMSLHANAELLEDGGSITYRVSVDEAPATDVIVELSNGELITIPAGETTGSVEVEYSADDIGGLSSDSISVSIADAAGGNYEDIDVSTDSVTTNVVDEYSTGTGIGSDNPTVSLNATSSITEAGGDIVYTAEVTEVPVTDLTVILDNGEEIIIEAGETSGSTIVTVSESEFEDVHVDSGSVSASIESVSGGGLDDLAIDNAPAFTEVTETIDTTILSLQATPELSEGGGTIVYTASVDNPAETDVTVTLSTGEQITIPAGETSGELSVSIAESEFEDVYTDSGSISVKIIRAEGGNFENLDINTETVVTEITETEQTTTLGLSVEPEITEAGANVTYTATVDNPPETDMTVMLSNGEEILITAGQTSGTATINVPASELEDVYAEDDSFSASITGTSGGNYENLVIDETPAVTNVEDTIDTTTLSLRASSITEAGGDVTYTATVNNPSNSDIVVILDNGEVITIPAGETSGSATVNVPEDQFEDGIVDSGSISASIENVTGGDDFEDFQVNYSPAVSNVAETIDTTTVRLDATSELSEDGGTIVYTASVNNAASSDVTVTLSNGETIIIPEGETSGTVEVEVSEDKFEDVYTDDGKVSATITDVEGGSFEFLELDDSPAITSITDTADSTNLSLSANVSEISESGGKVIYTASVDNPADSDMTVTLSTGDTIMIPRGQTSGNITLEFNQDELNDVYEGGTLSTSIESASGGNFENFAIDDSPVVTDIADDVIDTTTVTLSATDELTVKGGTVTYTAQTNNAAESDMVVTLSNGEEITILAGETSGSVSIEITEEQISEGGFSEGGIPVEVTEVSGGSFEDVVAEDATAVTEVIPVSEVVFIGSDVPNQDEIIDDMDVHAQIVQIGSDDPVSEIESTLSEYNDLDTVRIISHGGDGYLEINGQIIDSDYIDSHTDQFENIGNAIAENGDILCYGCNVANNEIGDEFINSLADATGADVAASIDDVGGIFGWGLEEETGTIESPEISVDNYDDVLGIENEVDSDVSGNEPLEMNENIPELSDESEAALEKSEALTGNLDDNETIDISEESSDEVLVESENIDTESSVIDEDDISLDEQEVSNTDVELGMSEESSFELDTFFTFESNGEEIGTDSWYNEIDDSQADGSGMGIESNGNSWLDEVEDDKSEGASKGKDGDEEDFNDLCEETDYDPESGPDKYDDDFNSSDFDSMIF